MKGVQGRDNQESSGGAQAVNEVLGVNLLAVMRGDVTH